MQQAGFLTLSDHALRNQLVERFRDRGERVRFHLCVLRAGNLIQGLPILDVDPECLGRHAELGRDCANDASRVCRLPEQPETRRGGRGPGYERRRLRLRCGAHRVINGDDGPQPEHGGPEDRQGDVLR